MKKMGALSNKLGDKVSSSAVGGMATKTTTMVPKPSFKAGKKALKKLASQDEEEKPPPSRSVVRL